MIKTRRSAVLILLRTGSQQNYSAGTELFCLNSSAVLILLRTSSQQNYSVGTELFCLNRINFQEQNYFDRTDFRIELVLGRFWEVVRKDSEPNIFRRTCSQDFFRVEDVLGALRRAALAVTPVPPGPTVCYFKRYMKYDIRYHIGRRNLISQLE